MKNLLIMMVIMTIGLLGTFIAEQLQISPQMFFALGVAISGIGILYICIVTLIEQKFDKRR